MLVAVHHMGSVGVGITQPQFFRADDEKLYVVKLQNYRLGTKVLANEYLAAQFGERLNLCFPPSDTIEIKEELISQFPELIEQGVLPGRYFASRFLDNAEYLSKLNLPKAANIAEMAGVMLFDHLLHNADRSYNRKNLLLRQQEGQFRIYAIDNSHLIRSGAWTVSTLYRLATRKKIYSRYTYGILLKDYLQVTDFLPCIARLKAIDNKEIERIINDIPEEWLSDADERRALLYFIGERFALVDEVYRKLCRQIPEERGGSRFLFSEKQTSEQV